MPENAVLQQRQRLSRVEQDIAYLAQFLRELQQITAAAREVTWQRYNTDLGDALGRDFPGVSSAILRLSNLVGVPTTKEYTSESPLTRAANQGQQNAR
jgi:hypothetical protein